MTENRAEDADDELQNWEVMVLARGKTTAVEVQARTKFEAKEKAEERRDVRHAKPGDDAVVRFERTGINGGKEYISERDSDEK